MKIEWLDGDFTVCQLRDAKDADLTVPFTFFARTDREISSRALGVTLSLRGATVTICSRNPCHR